MNKVLLFLLVTAINFLYASQPNLCDILAADPSDKSLPENIKGVKLKDIKYEKAIKSCTKVTIEFPDESRYFYQLGRAYDASKNYEQAFKYYSISANKGNINAQKKLSRIYQMPILYGNIVKYDMKQSFLWMKKAAKQGDIRAQNLIASRYDYGGFSVKKDCKEALKWYRKSAQGGHKEAQKTLGDWLLFGRDCVKRNIKESLKWFTLSAKNGNTDAQIKLAELYSQGKYVKRKDSTALFWYKKALPNVSSHWKPKVQSWIAGLYMRGSDCSLFEQMLKYCKKNEYYGLQKNFKKAFEWEMKAALQGYKPAQESISNMYYSGNGVKKNYILSYAWLNLAKSNESTDDLIMKILEKKFDNLERKMTPHQIAIAQEYDPIKANRKKLNSINKKNTSKTYTGTGFFINESTVITNHHVVQKCKSIEVVRGEYKSDANLLVEDSRNDLAVLKIKRKNNSFLQFRARKGIRVGDEIIVLGYPLGKLLGSGVKLTTGNVSSLTGLADDATNMQITAPVQPGNSGGPLLDRSGNIVGVIVARLEKDLSGNVAQNVNIAIKSNVLQMLLDTKNIDYDVSMQKEAKEVADIADDTKNSVVQVVCHE